MRDIYLHGALGARYGRHHRLSVETAGEAVRALCANFPAILKDLHEGTWRVVRGETPRKGMDLDEEQIASFRLGSAPLHVLPVAAGGKRNGAIKAIIGVALVAVSFGSAAFLAQPIAAGVMGATTWGNALGTIGLSMALSGVSMLLTPQSDSGANKNDDSFLMSGPVGGTRQGTPVPVVYGEIIVPGVMISGGLDIEMLDDQTSYAGGQQQPTTLKPGGGRHDPN